jgi:hypothetical protein
MLRSRLTVHPRLLVYTPHHPLRVLHLCTCKLLPFHYERLVTYLQAG